MNTRCFSSLRLVLVTIALASVSPSILAETKILEPRACLPKADFSIGGIGFDDTMETVTKKLGKPLRTESLTSEDDGGEYKVQRHIFDSMEVDIARGSVERVAATSERASFAYGVRVGMKESDVGVRLRYEAMYRGAHTIRMSPCTDVVRDELWLTFQKSTDPLSFEAVLTTIEITRYGP